MTTILEPFYWQAIMTEAQREERGIVLDAWRFTRSATMSRAYPARRAGIPKPFVFTETLGQYPPRHHAAIVPLEEWKKLEPLECSACGKPFPPGTNANRRYCRPGECSNLATIRCNPGHARWAVSYRDKGICSECGIDTNALPLPKRESRDHGWEMEHTVPISEGGGLCGLDGLTTLCIKCHNDSTALLARRLADARKGQLRIEPGLRNWRGRCGK